MITQIRELLIQAEGVKGGLIKKVVFELNPKRLLDRYWRRTCKGESLGRKNLQDENIPL